MMQKANNKLTRLKPRTDGPVEEKASFSSFSDTVFILSHNIIGISTISVAKVLEETGLALGIIFILLVSYSAVVSITLLIKAGNMAKQNTYQGLMFVVLGRPGKIIISVLQFASPYISMIGSNIIIGDLATKVVRAISGRDFVGGFYGSREFLATTVVLGLAFPFSLQKQIGVISKWSLLALLLNVVFLIIVAVRLGTLDVPESAGGLKVAQLGGTVEAISITTSIYAVHHNAFLIFDDMEVPSVKRWSVVSEFSVVISSIILLSFGILGYLTFTGFTQGNLLENYCRDDTLMNIVRGFFLLLMVIFYPLNLFIPRKLFSEWAFRSHIPAPLWLHVLVTFCLVVSGLGFSFTTSCVEILNEIGGFLAAVPLFYILPPLAILLLQEKLELSFFIVKVVGLLLGGIFITIFGIVITVIHVIQGIHCFDGSEPVYCLQNNTFEI